MRNSNSAGIPKAADRGLRRHLYTIGHSNRELDEFIRLLEEYRIELLVDVRRFPTSAKYPHFRRENLAVVLPAAGIEYRWMGDLLGGYRTGGYEAYMGTDGFQRGLELLLQRARWKTVAVMCAEKLFFRCHRRFIADACVALGWEVRHIIDPGRVSKHKLRISPDGQLELDFG